MKTLASFKNEWMGKVVEEEDVTHCKSEEYKGVKYLLAINKDEGYGWCVLHAEREDEEPLQDGEVNIGAFGTTYADCVDLFFWA